MIKKEPSLFAKILIAMFSPWTSNRLWLAIVSIMLLMNFFWVGVYYLYSIPTTHVAAFESMFQTIAWGIVTVVVGFILDMPNLLNGFKRTVASTTSNVVQNLLTKEEVKKDINIVVTENYDPLVEAKYAEKYALDESYQPPPLVVQTDEETFR